MAGEDATPLEQTLYQLDITSEVFLDNLKTATPWVVRVLLAASISVFTMSARSSVENTAISPSPRKCRTLFRGLLSLYAPVSFFRRVTVW